MGGGKGAARTRRSLIKPYRVTDGRRFRLAHVDPADTGALESEHKDASRAQLAQDIQRLAELQAMLYAQDRWAVLLVIQAMDAAGKDSTIDHVMSGVNPQGCQVYAFKVPSSEELDHDFLWRTNRCLPERGRIGIFNRSYYEEVLVVRVHPEILARQKLPQRLVSGKIWKQRHRDIRRFERYLSRNGVLILKFFLHVSKGEQKRRFLSRLDEPEKNWKFSAADVAERRYWGDYMQAYEDAIRATATPEAPWFVVPADNKWYTRLVVAAAVVDALESLDLRYPQVDDAKRAELASTRAMLMGKEPAAAAARSPRPRGSVPAPASGTPSASRRQTRSAGRAGSSPSSAESPPTSGGSTRFPPRARARPRSPSR
jgi:PPK2 family polyphosphate:nucleotide phosphotransferase